MQSENMDKEQLQVKWHYNIDVQHIQCATLKMLHYMLVHSQAAASLSLKVVQACDFSCDTDAHASAESPTLLAGTCCNEAQCEAEASTATFMSTFVCLHRISSLSPDSTGAIFFSLCGGVLSLQ